MKLRKLLYPVSVLLVLSLLLLLPTVASAAITKRFKSAGHLVVGDVVSINDAQSDTVVAANLTNVAALYGVVTDLDEGGYVEVANTEVTDAFVSLTSGDIKVGDPITASILNGVGQKAVASTRIVGYAQADFNSKSKGTTTKKFKDTSGRIHSITYGGMPVQLAVSNYTAPTPSGSGGSSLVPTALQGLANSLAGHTVVPTRIILSLCLLLVAIFVIGVMISTAVRRSLTAIGRNPLSSHSVLAGTAQVALVAVTVLAGALGGAYLIVTR